MNNGLAPRFLIVPLCLIVSLGLAKVGAQQTHPPPKAPSLQVLTQVSDIRALSAKEAELGHAVRIRGVVTFFGGSSTRPGNKALFVQDTTDGIYVNALDKDLTLTPGELVEVKGVTSHGWFANQIEKPEIHVLSRAPLPEPRRPGFEELASGREDDKWVEITGIVHSTLIEEPSKWLILSLAVGSGRVRISVRNYPMSALTALVDSKLRIQGTCGVLLNPKHQMVGAAIYAQDTSFLRILEPSPLIAESPPLESIRDLARLSAGTTSGHRVKLRGIVTLQRPFSSLYIVDATESLKVRTSQPTAVVPGDAVEVWGFPALGENSRELEDSEFRKLASGPPPAPVDITVTEALQGHYDSSLVRVQGRIFELVAKGDPPAMVVESGQVAFQARVLGEGAKAALRRLGVGSRVRITGVCEVLAGENGTAPVFRLLARSPYDVEVLEKPAWWNLQRLLGVLGLMAAVILVTGAWVILLRKEVRAKTREIREWLRREAALKDRYRDLLENAIDMVYTCDLQGNFTSVNATALRVIGYTQQEALSMNFHQIVAPEYQKVALGAANEAGEGQEPPGDEVEILTKQGARLVVEIRSRRLYEDGKAVGLQGIARDVTERNRAEVAIRESERKYRQLHESLIDGFVRFDKDGRIIEVNEAFCKMVGYEAEELRNLTAMDLTPEKWHAVMDEIFESQVVARGYSEIYEKEYRRKDGAIISVELRTYLLPDETGKPCGTWAIVRDITEQKRAEVELHRAKEIAEAANRAKSEFLANMSHEIRTPMNGIIGMTDLALDTPLTSEQREYLSMVKDSADSLLTLINDILDFSKIEAGKLSLDPVKFDLYDALANATRALSVRASQKKLELAWMAEPEVPQNVVGDAGRLRQVIVNLVGNAIKFTEQGEVVLGVGVESRRDEDVLLHLTVRDTGIGIPLEKQETIFEAFTQADSSMTRKHEGTGLGLTISLRLVKMMGGRIWVESAPDHGSTFHFTARMGLSKEAITESVPREMVNLRDLPVLVVDDNHTNRKILKAMLQHWMMRPVVAASGREGLVVLEQAVAVGAPFPLVLLDAQMPDMDGFALADRIKHDPALAGATIMMLTSAGQRGDAQRCRELGIAVYLIKPIRQSELLEAILAALGKAPASGERATVITRHTLRESRRKLQILLAEDNPVNQQIVIRLLEKRGHLVTVGSDGSEALAILKTSRFDIVLMDVQMPGMDGLQATAAIRKEEKSTGKHIPIIAMTAHAMEGDRERCLAAGMDGYVPKPIKVEDLVEAIESLVRPREIAKVTTTVVPRRQEPLDAASALARVGGDVAMLNYLVALFLKGLPDMLTNLREAMSAGDAHAIERAAHQLKGSVGTFAAEPACQAALKLELLGRNGSLTETEPAYAELENEVKRLKSAMATLRGFEVGA